MSYTLHRGDALTVLKTLPDESVNAVITEAIERRAETVSSA